MDAFYVAVELLRRPELRGKPVIVAGRGPRAVVTTASYEARPFGVGSAIPVAFARRRCPDLVHLPVDMDHYRARSREVMALVGELGVPTQPVSLDEVYLDLSSVPDPVARMSGLVRSIREQLHLDASVGMGPNRLVAKVASDAEKPRGFVVLTREQAAKRFAPAPPRLLPGVGPKTAERLEALGVRTIGDLQGFPREELVRRFGQSHGDGLHRRAHFRDDSAVERLRGEVALGRDHLRLRHRRDRGARARARRAVATARRPSCASARCAGGRSGSRSASTTGPRSPACTRSRRRPTTPS